MVTPKWLAIVEDEIILCLTPEVLTQIEQDQAALVASEPIAANRADDVIYSFNCRELLSLLASSVGVRGNQGQGGAIIIWTYYGDRLDEIPINPYESELLPILRTLIYIDGDLHQKIRRDILDHPLSDRICQAHSYIIGQIATQVVQAISNYVDEKLRPWTLATISSMAVFGWCDLLKALGQRLGFPDLLLSNCWGMAITIPLITLIIWWLGEQITWQLPALPSNLGIAGRSFFKQTLNFLEHQFLQTWAIACLIFMVLSGTLIYFAVIPSNSFAGQVINFIQAGLKPYLPIALISIRKRIVRHLIKFFQRYPFVIKLIFQRFLVARAKS